MAQPKLKPKTYSSARLRFAQEVVGSAAILDEYTAETLIHAFSTIPRERFVAEAFNRRAFEDTALPLGYGQTISKPSTVARMLGIVGVRPGMRVLEVGCGSGYCSAIMAAAGAQVFAVEYVGLLAQRTRKLLDVLNLQNILIRRGDGRRGWLEHAPYDAIVVSAAFERIEPELVQQLGIPGGRLVAPISRGAGQTLTLIETTASGIAHYELESCNFVQGAVGLQC